MQPIWPNYHGKWAQKNILRFFNLEVSHKLPGVTDPLLLLRSYFRNRPFISMVTAQNMKN